ncbi:uncharacterized protein N7479_001269 [Penicillium vulpinum]|uniref:uncharacterized protein n=1 Tax=Penicillium vulpinum TaxID=29845 RepID=UPI0025497AA1|nr:uncharacterized protein N7479_001269 [Penicillium vulpinum]KAJ5971351.1 hypothetical protein N7479_001269 [Penicillium vulpinum]
MDDLATGLLGDACMQCPLLLRPLFATVYMVIEGAKLTFYILLPFLVAVVILIGTITAFLILLLGSTEGSSKKIAEGRQRRDTEDK